MESKAKLFGHPIHQMLIVFPLGLLVMACVFDIICLCTGRTDLYNVAFWDIGAGVICGLIAAVLGLWDWLAVPAGTRAKFIGMWHGLGNVVVVLLFAASWAVRFGHAGHIPDAGALVLSFCGLIIGAVTGWMGGELVDRLRVGVDDGANLNAPNSLTHPSVQSEGGSFVSEETQRKAA